ESDYYFYYRHEDTDSLLISVSVRNETIEEVLNKAFEGTTVKYTVDGKKIYVANDRLIVTSLPIGFFGNAPTRRSDEAVEDVFAYMYADNEDKIKTDESKLFVIGRKSGETLQGSANLAGH